MRLGAVVVIGGLAIFAGPPLLHHLTAAPHWAEPVGDAHHGSQWARSSKRQLVVEADSDNQCYLEAFANGQKFRFLLDSGAAGVFFSIRHARRLGLDPARLSFDHTYDEWGGHVRGATFHLREFRVGGFTLHDVNAVMDEVGGVVGDTPLLGSPVLKLMGFQMRDGSCVLLIG
jgi:clan AA aspartic protease (TIGR02281 family)